MWAEGIEQMLATTGKLILPISNHNYLRTIVFSLADAADASAERQREERAREGAHLHPASSSAPSASATKLADKLAWLRSQLEYGQITPEQHAAQVAAAKQDRQ